MRIDSASPYKLLVEKLIVLANQIKKTTFQHSSSEFLPLPTRAVLQDLSLFGSQTVPDLARRRNSSRQNVQTIVNRLERLGYVSSGFNPAHKKADLLTITDSGRLLMEKAERDHLKLMDALEGALSPQEASEVVRLLEKMKEAVVKQSVAEPKQGFGVAREAAPKRAVPEEDKPILGFEAVSDEEDSSLPVNLL